MGNVIQELLIRIRYVVDNGGLERSNNAVRSLRRTIAGIGVGAGLYKVGQTAVQTAAQLESAQAQFETMLGSKAAADKMMNEMWEYAAMSTFEMTDVTKAATTMLNYGFSQDQTSEAMKRLGDIAGDSAPKFQRMALAYAQSFGKMRLTGEELRQFINAGANPLKEIANKHFKGDYAAAEEAMRKRKISFAMVEEAMKSLTDAGGKFHGNQLRQSKTLTGVHTTMKDRLKATLAKMVMAFSVPLKALMTYIGKIDFSTVINGIQWLAYAVEYLARQIWGTGMKEGWEGFVQGLKDAGIAMTDAGGPTYALGNLLRALGMALGIVLGLFFKTLTLLTNVILPALAPVMFVLKELTGILYGVVLVFKWLAGGISYFLDNVIGPLGAALAVMGMWWLTASAAVSGFGVVAGGVFATITSFVTTGLPALIAGLTSMLTPFWAIAAAAFAIGFAVYKIKQAVDEKEQRELKAIDDEARGVDEDYLNKTNRELTEAKKTGDKKLIAKRQAAYDKQKAIYERDWLTPKDPGIGDFDLDTFIKKTKDGNDFLVKQQIDANGKTTNINQKIDMKVAVEGDKNAKSGLTAGDVALLAERASRATFTLELERVLTGVL